MPRSGIDELGLPGLIRVLIDRILPKLGDLPPSFCRFPLFSGSIESLARSCDAPVASRGFDDMGLVGKAVRTEPGSRGWLYNALESVSSLIPVGRVDKSNVDFESFDMLDAK